jgi:hypothetical protein
VRSLLGGGVFLCGLLICSWCILGGEMVDAREDSKGDYLVGPAFIGGLTFPNGRRLWKRHSYACIVSHR